MGLMNNIDNFIWDFDGTLYNTYPYTIKAFVRALSEDGFSVDEAEVYTLMMQSITYATKAYCERLKVGEETWKRFKRYSNEENILTSPPFRYATDILSRISENGCTNYMYTHRDDKVFEFLKDGGLIELFKEIVTIGNGFKHKPDPEAVLYLVDKYGLDRDRTMMIGDRECDILSGSRAGVKTCYITNGNGTAVTADYTFSSLLEMYKAI